MSTDRQSINKIIAHWFNGTIQPYEQEILEQWLLQLKNREFFDEITREGVLLTELKIFYEASQRAGIINKRILRQYTKKKIVQIPLLGWQKYVAVAACLILIVTASIYIYDRNNNKPLIVTATKEEAGTIKDIKAGTMRSTLTLADGRTITLDSTVKGNLLQLDNTLITNNTNTLSYTSSGGHQSGNSSYNTLSTAYGQTYALVLSDGTKVWLNAGSSLRYPVVFNNKERVVEISGEAYFEVAKQTRRSGGRLPFRVKMGDSREVEVLGTHFNINAYNNEPVIKTTLLEGKISVRNGKQQKILITGQQASYLKDSITVMSGVDAEQAVAWKDGLFVFDNYDLQTIMRYIERWYNIKVEIDPDFPNDIYNGTIARNSQLSDVLKALKFTSEVNYRLDGRVLTVGF
jgi:transmembrane sensor